MIEEQLRELMPVKRRLSPQRRQQIKETVMSQIRADEARTEPPRRGRKIAGVIAVAAVVATSGIAAAVGLSRPDPAQSARVVESNKGAARTHLDGWRPALRAESVACVSPTTAKLTDPRESGNTSASEFPLDERLTEEILISECTTNNDWARSRGDFDPELATACVRDGAYPLAVVALDGLPCSAAGVGVRHMRASDLEELNRMRALEVAVLAGPNECPGLDQAREWTQQQLADTRRDLEVRVSDEGSGCYRGMIYWHGSPWTGERAAAVIERIGDQPDSARASSASTTAPSTLQ